MKDTGEMKGILTKFHRDTSIAHVSEDGRAHPLYDHLLGTAGLAADFAAEFGCREWGYLAGLWHDLVRIND